MEWGDCWVGFLSGILFVESGCSGNVGIVVLAWRLAVHMAGLGPLDIGWICEQVIHCMTAGLSKAYSKLHGGFGLSLRAGLFYGLG